MHMACDKCNIINLYSFLYKRITIQKELEEIWANLLLKCNYLERTMLFCRNLTCGPLLLLITVLIYEIVFLLVFLKAFR